MTPQRPKSYPTIIQAGLLASLRSGPRITAELMKHYNQRSESHQLTYKAISQQVQVLREAGWIEWDWENSEHGRAPHKAWRLTKAGKLTLGTVVSLITDGIPRR